MSSTPETGYSIADGNAASRTAYGWAKKTFATRAGLPGEPAQDLDGGFSNEIRFGAERLGISSDGIGTKIEVAERLDRYDTLGYDLVAMTADDLVAAGFVPTNLSNIIDVRHLDASVIDELMRGLHDACQFARIAITGGEIAELGERIGGYPGARMNFNWCSTAIGVLHPSLPRPLSGATAQAGDAVVALHSPSFRSNGYSLARKTLARLFGDEWHKEPFAPPAVGTPSPSPFPDGEGGLVSSSSYSLSSNDGSSSSLELETRTSPPPHRGGARGGVTWGDALLAPSLIYAPGITALLDAGLPLRAAAHITGGGVADNFQRVLKNGLGAVLDGLFAPLPAMQRLLEIGDIPLETAYLYWNMGNGLLLVVAPDAADAVVQHLAQNGYAAQVAGYLTSEPGITLRLDGGRELRYA